MEHTRVSSCTLQLRNTVFICAPDLMKQRRMNSGELYLWALGQAHLLTFQASRGRKSRRWLGGPDLFKPEHAVIGRTVPPGRK